MQLHLEHPTLTAAEGEHWASTVAPLTTLERVMRWGRDQAPPCPILEIVTQDEYTHDVVLRPAAGIYLAFDTT